VCCFPERDLDVVIYKERGRDAFVAAAWGGDSIGAAAATQHETIDPILPMEASPIGGDMGLHAYGCRPDPGADAVVDERTWMCVFSHRPLTR
jgi:hypothetical protein